jgi:hypothetical protein
MSTEEAFFYFMVAVAVVYLIVLSGIILRALFSGIKEGNIERREYRLRREAWAKKTRPGKQVPETSTDIGQECLRPISE